MTIGCGILRKRYLEIGMEMFPVNILILNSVCMDKIGVNFSNDNIFSCKIVYAV